MSDPFMDVDAASAEVIEIISTALETRAADPSMLPVINAYLDALSVPDPMQTKSVEGRCDHPGWNR